MKYIAIFFILISPVLYSAACNKTNTNPADSPQGKLLSAAPWKKIAATAQQIGQPEEDIWTNTKSSDKDDLYIFKTDGYYVTGAANDDKKTRWNISQDGKVLLIIEAEELGGAEFPYQIETLTSTTLKVTRVLDKQTLTETYAH